MATTLDDSSAAVKIKARVTAPPVKFTIGAAASLCAVLMPRLLAALAVKDQASINFVTGEYLEVAGLFSVLVVFVVMILEWRVPRAPGDTFMTALGVPAILAGALTTNQNAMALQEKTQSANAVADILAKEASIPIESSKPARAEGSPQSGLVDALVPTIHAESAMPPSDVDQARLAVDQRLAVRINQPHYLIVLDRAASQPAAQTRATHLMQRLASATPSQPVTLRVQQQGNEFLVVESGAARAKSDAVLEAVRLKNVYHVNPALVEVN